MIPGTNISDYTYDDLRKLDISDLRVTAMALNGVLKMRDIDLARERVARYFAEYNYAGVMLTKAKDELKRAEARNRGEP